jgi:phage terminase large subunit GpA-like protein
MSQVRKFISEVLKNLEVEEKLKPSEWVEKYRVIPGYAAESGSVNFNKAAYQREWLDIILKHQRIAIMASAQVGKTETLINLLSYLVDSSTTPTPILMVHPIIKMAEKFSKDKLLPTFKATPRLRERLDLSSRNADNTILHKRFKDRDVTLDIASAQSPDSLASQTIRVVIADEIDKYEILPAGDPIALAEKRTQTYSNFIHYYITTPLDHGTSRIEQLWLKSDQREFHVQCPFDACRHPQTLKIENMRFEEGKAHYQCAKCARLIPEHYRFSMIQDGEWIPKHPERSSEQVGYHINELYSPWSSWTDVLSRYHQAKDNETHLKQFYNEVLGLPYSPVVGERPDWKRLSESARVTVKDELPEHAYIVLASVDVQKNRLLVLITGWSKRICTVMHYITIPGNPYVHDDPCWTRLEDIRKNMRWKNPVTGCHHQIVLTAIDSGDGNSTAAVYNWARTYCEVNDVLIVKGFGSDKGLKAEIGTPSNIEYRDPYWKKKRITHQLWPVNTHMLKDMIYNTLRTNGDYPNEKIVFSTECDDEFFRQVTSEALVKQSDEFGNVRLVWKKIYPENHALDCLVYSYAAFYAFQYNRWSNEEWDYHTSGRYAKDQEAEAKRQEYERMQQEAEEYSKRNWPFSSPRW